MSGRLAARKKGKRIFWIRPKVGCSGDDAPPPALGCADSAFCPAAILPRPAVFRIQHFLGPLLGQGIAGRLFTRTLVSARVPRASVQGREAMKERPLLLRYSPVLGGMELTAKQRCVSRDFTGVPYLLPYGRVTFVMLPGSDAVCGCILFQLRLLQRGGCRTPPSHGRCAFFPTAQLWRVPSVVSVWLVRPRLEQRSSASLGNALVAAKLLLVGFAKQA